MCRKCGYSVFNTKALQSGPAVYSSVSSSPSLLLDIQGDQLNMAVFFWYLEKENCLVYATILAKTG